MTEFSPLIHASSAWIWNQIVHSWVDPVFGLALGAGVAWLIYRAVSRFLDKEDGKP